MREEKREWKMKTRMRVYKGQLEEGKTVWISLQIVVCIHCALVFFPAFLVLCARLGRGGPV